MLRFLMKLPLSYGISTVVPRTLPEGPKAKRRGTYISPSGAKNLLACALSLALTTGFAWGAGPNRTQKVRNYEGKVLILNYHHIGRTAKEEGPATISVDRFKEHLAFLWQDGFNVISLDTLRFFLDGRVKLPSKAVCITFDDGYSSYAELAVPALAKYSWPSACFVMVKDAGNPVQPGRLPHMSWKTMGKLKDTGLITFGSHTYDAHGLLPGSTPSNPLSVLAYPLGRGTTREETAEAYKARVGSDLAKSRSIMERRLGTGVRYLAYPYGVWNERLKGIAAASGFDLMFTTDSGFISEGSPKWALPRLNAGSSWVDTEYLWRRINDLPK